jgi:hypothetical protein
MCIYKLRYQGIVNVADTETMLAEPMGEMGKGGKIALNRIVSVPPGKKILDISGNDGINRAR